MACRACPTPPRSWSGDDSRRIVASESTCCPRPVGDRAVTRGKRRSMRSWPVPAGVFPVWARRRLQPSRTPSSLLPGPATSTGGAASWDESTALLREAIGLHGADLLAPGGPRQRNHGRVHTQPRLVAQRPRRKPGGSTVDQGWAGAVTRASRARWRRALGSAARLARSGGRAVGGDGSRGVGPKSSSHAASETGPFLVAFRRRHGGTRETEQGRSVHRLAPEHAQAPGARPAGRARATRSGSTSTNVAHRRLEAGRKTRAAIPPGTRRCAVCSTRGILAVVATAPSGGCPKCAC